MVKNKENVCATIRLGDDVPLVINTHFIFCPACGDYVGYYHHKSNGELWIRNGFCPPCKNKYILKRKKHPDFPFCHKLYDDTTVYLNADWEQKKDEILEKHRKWLNGEKGGAQAELWGNGPNLKYDFSGADLRWAQLKGNFSGSNFSGANLNFIYADANFVATNFSGASLCFAEFFKGDYYKANFIGANLIGSSRYEYDFEYDKSRCEKYFEQYADAWVCDDYDCSIIDKDGNKIPLTKIMDDIEKLCK